MEKVKTLTQEALDKMYEGNQYLVYPKAMRQFPLAMSDMVDGLGGYHTIESVEQCAPISWKATSLTDDLEFIHYAFDEDGEKDALKCLLEAEGLVDIRKGIKVDSLIKEDVIANGFAIVSSREIKVLQALCNESAV